MARIKVTGWEGRECAFAEESLDRLAEPCARRIAGKKTGRRDLQR
jgi:hypothetical protein